MSADKQLILVTGATSGIGYDTCYALAAASTNNHVILGARNVSKGEDVLAQLQARKPQTTFSVIELDVTKDESIDAAVKKIEEDFGRLDVLVNNAGVMIDPPTRAVLHTTFETNVFGPSLLTSALIPLLKASSSPKVVNVSSDLGSIGRKLDSTAYNQKIPREAYRMSKAALNMLTAIQTVEFAEFGGKVWSYCPGYVVTNLTGEEGRKERIQRGAESSETSANGIVEIVEGKRDDEVGKFITRYGKQYPW
ncbi:short chain dehydrogenase [Setomelanomma holmii]|uniref:Short chain dehydrogenase n=1 Tax=Setomelanomma holmii TaxID=210430 RepID=A0A9P4LMX6_9PLEO|nr:short chain dehydrogenase [Setomelanomma holmii]